MKHTAQRLLSYMGKNKVIHVDDVEHPALKRLLYDERALPKIREALKEIDPQIEVLIPRVVDSKENQLKRYIQYYVGTRVNINKLKEEYGYLYFPLTKLGHPEKMLEKWGLSPRYNTKMTEDEIKELLEEIAENGIVEGLHKDHRKLYYAIEYQAKKKGITIKEYLKNLGYTFRRRRKHKVPKKAERKVD